MKLLLLLEHPFERDSNGNIWSQRVIDYNYLKRYLSVFDELQICARIKDVTEKSSDYKLIVSGDNVSFYDLPFIMSTKNILKKYFKLRSLFKDAVSNSNAVIIRGPSVLSLLLYDICINKVPFCVEFVMGADKILNKNNFIAKILNKYFENRAKKMCLSANGVSYVTKQKLQEKYPSYSIIYGENERYFDEYYSSIDLFDTDYLKKDKDFNDKPKKLEIIHIGYMDDNRKGQIQVIEIINKLILKGYEVRMTFIGDGKTKKDLINYTKKLGISERFRFVGNITEKSQKNEYLKNAHLFLLPTYSEGLPRVLIEAMATSTPCISTPVDGIPELLNSKYLIERDNIDAYVNKIIYLYNNWDLMIELSNEVYKKAKEYHYEILSERRKSFYSKLKNISK